MNRFLINTWNIVSDTRFWKAVSIVSTGFAVLAPKVISPDAGSVLMATGAVAIALAGLCGQPPGKVEPPQVP